MRLTVAYGRCSAWVDNKLAVLRPNAVIDAGLRVGIGSRQSPVAPAAVLVQHMDHLLLDCVTARPALQPDVVLQLGGRLTSKRLAQFLEWAALGSDGRCALPLM